MQEMNSSEKNKRISKRFRILMNVTTFSWPVFLVPLLIFFDKISTNSVALVLIFILSMIIWLSLVVVVMGRYAHFREKYIADKSSELGLREILEANMDLEEYEPLQRLPKQTLLNCSVIFPEDFFDGRIDYSGSHLIRGKYNGKSFEMSSVKLDFTRNTAGQPVKHYFDGTIVILHPKTNADPDTLYLFPKNHQSYYMIYALRSAHLNKVKPFYINNNWKCFSRTRAEAEQFFSKLSDWLSLINAYFQVQFIIYSGRCLLLGLNTKLFMEYPDPYMKEHFEQTLKRILTCCVDPLE